MELLWTFFRRAPHDPAALLRILAKAWKKNVPVNEEKVSVPAILADLHEQYKAIEALGKPDGPEGLLRYYQFAVTYREIRANEKELREFGKTHTECKDWVRIGINIMQINYCITPKTLFGILVLHLMGLSHSKIAAMSEDFRIILMAIMTPSASAGKGSANRGVPQAFAALVDCIVEGMIPQLE